MAYLTDVEKRLLLAALSKELSVCEKIDNDKVDDGTCNMLAPVVKGLIKKFSYNRYEKEIREWTVDEFVEKLNTRCNEMVNSTWNNGTAPVSWAHAYADFKDDIEDVAQVIKKDSSAGKNVCLWKEDIYGRWHTQCNILADNDPLEYTYCPYCGKELKAQNAQK